MSSTVPQASLAGTVFGPGLPVTKNSLRPGLPLARRYRLIPA